MTGKISAGVCGACAAILLALVAGCVHQAADRNAAPVEAPASLAFDPRNVSEALAAYTARHLVQADMPLRASTRILTEVRQGFIDPEEGAIAQQLVDWYAQREPYARAVYLAEVLGIHWRRAEYNQFWLKRAHEMFRQESYADVILALKSLREPLDANALEQRDSLFGLTRLLQSMAPNALRVLETRQGFPHTNRTDHFNFAVAMIAHQRKVEGMALLDELAEMPADNMQDRAIRDRANMALGWIWLKAQKGGTARATFKRVSLNGPYSNLALLGLGWTELLPDDETQRIKFKRKLDCDDIKQAPEGTLLLLAKSYRACSPRKKKETYNFVYYRRFAFEAGGSEESRYRKALRWLGELGARDSSDPAVQEALLAIGYVQAQLGHRAEAISAYKLAADRYDAEIIRLQSLERTVHEREVDAGKLLGQDSHRGEFADLRSSRPYVHLSATLESTRQSEQEHAATADWIAQQIPATEQRQQLLDYVRNTWREHDRAIADSRAMHNAELTELIAASLTAAVERLGTYRADALLAIAQLYDRR